MKYAAILILSVAVLACQQDEHGNVSATPEAQATATQAKAQAKEAGAQIREGAQEAGAQIKEGANTVAESEAGQRIAEGAKDIGQGVKQGAGEAAEATGDALKRAGQKAQAEVKTETRATTTTNH
ncbi:MAG TPA: hypothetical protein VF698_19405 [Thermoanaerobaculia bacterium]|jgi:hypothetical protein